MVISPTSESEGNHVSVAAIRWNLISNLQFQFSLLQFKFIKTSFGLQRSCAQYAFCSMHRGLAPTSSESNSAGSVKSNREENDASHPDGEWYCALQPFAAQIKMYREKPKTDYNVPHLEIRHTHVRSRAFLNRTKFAMVTKSPGRGVHAFMTLLLKQHDLTNRTDRVLQAFSCIHLCAIPSLAKVNIWDKICHVDEDHRRFQQVLAVPPSVRQDESLIVSFHPAIQPFRGKRHQP